MINIKLELEVEDKVAEMYRQSSEEMKTQLQRKLSFWFQQLLQTINNVSATSDPWLEFLNNIDQYAVDTGIADLSINHEYYLYGGTKRA